MESGLIARSPLFSFESCHISRRTNMRKQDRIKKVSYEDHRTILLFRKPAITSTNIFVLTSKRYFYKFNMNKREQKYRKRHLKRKYMAAILPSS